MTDLREMSRVLYHHDWSDVHDWARNIEQLADLSDDQIGQLPRCDLRPDRSDCSERLFSGRIEVRRSLAARTRETVASLCGTLRPRRAG
jgi:hypothetical protein